MQVYPPVYGDSWKLLIDTFHVLLTHASAPTILVAWERRKGDQLDDFLAYCAAQSPAICCERLLQDTSSGEDIGIYTVTLAA